ncbi:hypothetical protein D3C86_1978410 [compost metagenome]
MEANPFHKRCVGQKGQHEQRSSRKSVRVYFAIFLCKIATFHIVEKRFDLGCMILINRFCKRKMTAIVGAVNTSGADKVKKCKACKGEQSNFLLCWM